MLRRPPGGLVWLGFASAESGRRLGGGRDQFHGPIIMLTAESCQSMVRATYEAGEGEFQK